MAKERITGSEALMRSLEHQGVKTLFGYPGGAIMPVFDALYDRIGYITQKAVLYLVFFSSL